jgi:hypothetical protein
LLALHSCLQKQETSNAHFQVVLDPNDRVIDIVARWPGSVPDSRILRESGVWALMEGGHLPPGDHYLLGDSGYPCKRWLLTPYLNPQPGSQTQYNRCSNKVYIQEPDKLYLLTLMFYVYNP